MIGPMKNSLMGLFFMVSGACTVACTHSTEAPVDGCRIPYESADGGTYTIASSPDWTVDYTSEDACMATSKRMCTICNGPEQPIGGSGPVCIYGTIQQPCVVMSGVPVRGASNL